MRLKMMSDEDFEQEKANGNISVEQENLRNKMVDLGNRYTKDGVKKDKVDKVLAKDLDKVEGGDIGEYTSRQRFTGKLKGKGSKSPSTPTSSGGSGAGPTGPSGPTGPTGPTGGGSGSGAGSGGASA